MRERERKSWDPTVDCTGRVEEVYEEENWLKTMDIWVKKNKVKKMV